MKTEGFKKHLIPLAIAGGVLLFDHITKWLAVQYLNGSVAITIIPNIFHFRYATNTGAAFSMLSSAPILLNLISSAVLVGIVWWYWVTPVEERLTRICQSLIIGGALGNLIDRWTRGYVVDFIDWHWKEVYHWPTFNVADSAIFCAVVVLCIYFVFFAEVPEKTDKKESSSSRKKSALQEKKS